MPASAPADKAQSLLAELRTMSLGEALRLARSPDPQERIALERMHGKLVWEALLRNPGLSIPEVIRIGSMGALPHHLMDVIVGNPGWIANEHVRRSLLANPALRGQNILTVLRLLPKQELEMATRQTAYTPAVRHAAAQLLRQLKR